MRRRWSTLSGRPVDRHKPAGTDDRLFVGVTNVYGPVLSSNTRRPISAGAAPRLMVLLCFPFTRMVVAILPMPSFYQAERWCASYLLQLWWAYTCGAGGLTQKASGDTAKGEKGKRCANPAPGMRRVYEGDPEGVERHSVRRACYRTDIRIPYQAFGTVSMLKIRDIGLKGEQSDVETVSSKLVTPPDADVSVSLICIA
jgi:hypothetical protein